MATRGALGALFYDAERPPVRDAELRWYVQHLPRDRGNVLEVMCGSGRLLLPLLRAGYAMHGLDASQALLDACAARVSAAHLHATLVHQEMHAVNLPFRYTAAFVAGGAFQRLVDPVAARNALARLRAHLVPPGVLLLDLSVPSTRAQRLGAALVEVRTARLSDGTRIALRSETTTHAEERIARTHNRYVHRRGAARLAEETESAAFTWYPPEEIAGLVADSGFDSVEIGAAPCEVEGVEAYAIIARV
ncbi:MAG TPA: class I SAM-dependent methyltransferase [Casimicrobiaceae bacterium]